MAAMLELEAEEALARLKDAPNPEWEGIVGSFDGEVWPEVEPGFRLSAGQTVFTIGSCFARTIEEHLARLGCRTPMLDLVLPPDEFQGKPGGALNRFHPPAFRQTVEWAAAIHDRDGRVAWEDVEPFAMETDARGYVELDVAIGVTVSRERFVERRQQIFDVVRTVFEADCLMMTPGLIEAWLDRKTGLYIHQAPISRAQRREGDRFCFRLLDYDECLGDLLKTIDVVRARNPAVKVLVTTSPIPLHVTFTGQDVRIANTQSKAVLRAACGAIPLLRPEVDYFPSYESVVLTGGKAWHHDRRHVAPGFAGKIMTRMLGLYFDGLDPVAELARQAQTAVRSAEPDAGLEAARRALELDPANAPAGLAAADALLKLGRTDEAIVLLEELRARPELKDNARLLRQSARAVVTADRERLDEAIDLMLQACALASAGELEFRYADKLLAKQPERAAEREVLARLGVERFPLNTDCKARLDAILDAQPG
jgi:tetratricopeptide (TPR) repeat protein